MRNPINKTPKINLKEYTYDIDGASSGSLSAPSVSESEPTPLTYDVWLTPNKTLDLQEMFQKNKTLVSDSTRYANELKSIEEQEIDPNVKDIKYQQVKGLFENTVKDLENNSYNIAAFKENIYKKVKDNAVFKNKSENEIIEGIDYFLMSNQENVLKKEIRNEQTNWLQEDPSRLKNYSVSSVELLNNIKDNNPHKPVLEELSSIIPKILPTISNTIIKNGLGELFDVEEFEKFFIDENGDVVFTQANVGFLKDVINKIDQIEQPMGGRIMSNPPINMGNEERVREVSNNLKKIDENLTFGKIQLYLNNVENVLNSKVEKELKPLKETIDNYTKELKEDTYVENHVVNLNNGKSYMYGEETLDFSPSTVFLKNSLVLSPNDFTIQRIDDRGDVPSNTVKGKSLSVKTLIDELGEDNLKKALQIKGVLNTSRGIEFIVEFGNEEEDVTINEKKTDVVRVHGTAVKVETDTPTSLKNKQYIIRPINNKFDKEQVLQPMKDELEKAIIEKEKSLKNKGIKPEDDNSWRRLRDTYKALEIADFSKKYLQFQQDNTLNPTEESKTFNERIKTRSGKIMEVQFGIQPVITDGKREFGITYKTKNGVFKTYTKDGVTYSVNSMQKVSNEIYDLLQDLKSKN